MHSRRAVVAFHGPLDDAQSSGQLRDGLSSADVLIIQTVLSSVMDMSGEVDAEQWRRYLGIVLDGLRPVGARRTARAVPALDADEVGLCMRTYRPRRRY